MRLTNGAAICAICIITVVQLISPSLGALADPPIEPLNPEPDGIKVIPNKLPSTTLIEIDENIPEAGNNLRVAKILIAGGTGEVTIESIIPTPPSPDAFKVENFEGEWFLVVGYPLDFEQNSVYNIPLYHGGSPSFVIFNVQDLNDNQVQIEKLSPELQTDYPEKQPPTNDVITTVQVFDADAIDQGKFTFELEQLIGDGPTFSLDAGGNLRFLKPFDYKEYPMHRLKATVFDSDRIHNATIIFTVDVGDLPDLEPEWTIFTPIQYVAEDKAVNTLVDRVVARDGDFGINWPILYSLSEDHPGVNEPYFRINETTGEIFLTRTIDAEDLFIQTESLSFTIYVTAKENATRPEDKPLELSITGNISINVVDINDNDPKICISETPGNNDCSTEHEFVSEINEETAEPLEYLNNELFIVRDLDATTAFSKYTVDFAPGTPPQITDAFVIQPTRESSGTTAYTIAVRNKDMLDYEGVGGFWWERNLEDIPVAKPAKFDIIITESESKKTATAKFTLTVKDVNDNSPVFQELTNTEYEFLVCENLEENSNLQQVSTPQIPNVCPIDPPSGIDLLIKAVDADISPQFGTPSIRYRWYEKARFPNLDLDAEAGTMTVNSVQNFDYERFIEEFFIVEAYDNADAPTIEQRVTNAPVKFVVLDKNDVLVDLKMPSGRPNISENIDSPGMVVFDEIVADDVDVNPSLDLTIEVVSLFSSGVSVYRNSTINADINKWFVIEKYPQDGDINKLKGKIVLGTEIIDRENGGEGDIDRVDLIVRAYDRNGEGGEQIMSQPLTIIIDDVNDQFPVWEDDLKDVNVTIMETDEFNPATGDVSTDIQREIYIFRARDPDKTAEFNFDIKTKDCNAEEAICNDLLNLVELSFVKTAGKATLRRKKGMMIDRENTTFYGKDMDFIYYTVSVTDEDPNHVTSVDITIEVEDINDNSPEWARNFTDVYEVNELVDTPIEIVKFLATDLDKDDKYGKVSYMIVDTNTPNNGFDEFKIDRDDGTFVAIVEKYNWTQTPEYTVTVEAVDNYRESSASGSNRISTTIVIKIIDENNHDPEFLTPTEGFLAEIPENIPIINEPFEEKVLVRDLDDPSLPNAQFFVSITKVVFNGEEMNPMPFKSGQLLPGNTDQEKLVEIVPTKLFDDAWGVYDVTFEATDENGMGRSSEQTYQIRIVDVNSHEPIFEYPNKEGDSRVLVFINATTGPLMMWNNTAVSPAYATDADDNSTPNGQIRYQVVETNEPDDGYNYFDVQTQLGTINLKTPLLDNPDAKLYKIMIEAADQGSPSLNSFTNLTIVVVPTANREPYFNETSAQEVKIMENHVGISVSIREAFDLDSDLGDEYPDIGDQKIYYHLVGGSTEPFETFTDDQEKPFIRTIEPLDREFIKVHTVVVFVSNSETYNGPNVPPETVPDDPRYLIVNIEADNEFDTHPEFDQVGVISGGISISNVQDEVVANISVTDLDDDDVITFEIASGFNASDPSLGITVPFKLDPIGNSTNSVSLVIQFTPQPAMKGYITFNVKATDKGGLSTTAQCKMYIIKDSNIVEFKFLNRRDFIIEKNNDLASVLTTAFRYRCNIDSNSEDISNPNATVVRAHFIDLTDNNPVAGNWIEEQQYIPEVYSNLIRGLSNIGVTLAPDGIGKQQSATNNKDQLTIYLLIGACGALVVIFILMGVTCYFNNRSLSRRVRALTATTFGSQNSGLNRTGAALDLPNTNEFAIEGSNPMWTSAAKEPAEKKMPIYDDNESVGSGGSILIGVEDDDDFKNYKSTNNPLFQAKNNEGEGDLDEDDYTRDIYDIGRSNSRDLPRKSISAPTANRTFNNDESDQSESEPEDFGGVGGGGNFSFEGPADTPNDFNYGDDEGLEPPNYDDIPMPTTTRRNPLMNMAYEDDD